MPIVAVDIIDPASGILPPTLGTLVGASDCAAPTRTCSICTTTSRPHHYQRFQGLTVVGSVDDHRRVHFLVAPVAWLAVMGNNDWRSRFDRGLLLTLFLGSVIGFRVALEEARVSADDGGQSDDP
jgi:hypothetical protein